MGNIYNFGLFGHNKSGKTTLGEAILFKGKAIDRMGNINQGNTCLDYDVEEIKRLMSINLSIGNLKWKDKKLYFADTPGYMDFVGEQISGIKAVDFAILNISADSGIEVGTEKLWEMIQKEKLPCLIFINKLDLPDINLTQLFKNIQSFFGKKTTFINLPVFENGKLNCVKG
ncbi:MAG TPA: GTP-binding protein, partial [bacterium]|nr:GTP-binding protein [bacterium]